MSDELRLPDNLAACEARLAAQSLPASRLDRDQLLYRAGWAAAEARMAALNPPTSKVEETPWRRGARGRILAAWSLTSAALAASLAVVATLQFERVEPEQVALRMDVPGAAKSSTAESQPHPRVKQSRPVPPPLRRERPLPSLDAGLLALRRDALIDPSSMNVRIASFESDVATPAAKTARELMEELLPAKGQRQFAWPWNTNRTGDSI